MGYEESTRLDMFDDVPTANEIMLAGEMCKLLRQQDPESLQRLDAIRGLAASGNLDAMRHMNALKISCGEFEGVSGRPVSAFTIAGRSAFISGKTAFGVGGFLGHGGQLEAGWHAAFPILSQVNKFIPAPYNLIGQTVLGAAGDPLGPHAQDLTAVHAAAMDPNDPNHANAQKAVADIKTTQAIHDAVVAAYASGYKDGEVGTGKVWWKPTGQYGRAFKHIWDDKAPVTMQLGLPRAS